MQKDRIPTTDSIEELAHFWDTHDLTDYEDELVEVTEPVFVLGGNGVIQLQLPKIEFERLSRIAQTKGMDSTSLVQGWVLEKLQAA